ncbi:C2 domain protein, partial [Cooperia oncophora]
MHILRGLPGNCGSITVTAEEVDADCGGDAEFHIRAHKLDRRHFICPTDPFLKIYRILDDHGRQLAYQSEHVKRTVSPVWKVFRVGMQALCGGDKKRQFVIECWDHDFSGRHHYIGECSISVEEVLAKRADPVPLINEGRANKGLCCGTYVNSGTLHFIHFQIVKTL